MNEAFRTQLIFEGLVGPIGAAVLVAAALALTAYQYAGFARLASGKRAALLGVLRLAAFAIAIAFLLGPTRLEQRYQKIRPTVAVVTDGSASMRLPADPKASGGRSRADAARGVLARDELFGAVRDGGLEGGLADEYQLRFFRADERATPLTRPQVVDVKPQGRATDLFAAVSQAVEESASEPLAGVVLLTDGAVNTGAADAAPFEGLKVPVVTIASATPAGYRDIRVASLELPDRAFAGSPATIRAKVVARGLAGRSVQVILREEGRVIATRGVRLTGDPAAVDVEFQHTWREIGSQSLSVSVPVLAEEAITTNNRKDGRLEIARDKIRVLVVSGSPSWNYRFIRQALKGDPSIDLLSFVILRTPYDTVDVPDYQLSLIPFPTHRLFNDEIAGFDLVVFDNFPYRLYFPTTYLENVRRFVEQGGAFAMFGGRSSFDLGGYVGTPIEPLLPVTLTHAGTDRYDPNPRQMALTDAGRRHPLMQVAASGEQNETVWKQMPALDGINVVGGPKPDAVVLATAPRTGGGETPLIAVGRHGKGRTLAFASDAFWRWNFESVGRGQANRHYLRFVNQMIRWLIDDPLFAPLSVRVDKEVYQPGDETKIVVRALNEDFSPAPGANVTLRLTGPDGKSQPVSVRPGERPGEFVAAVKPGEVGIYTLRAEARTGRRGAQGGGEGRGGDGQTDAPGTPGAAAAARPPARAEATFRLAPSSVEFEDAFPGEAYLAEVAKLTGGRAFTLADSQRLTAAQLIEAFPQRAEYRVSEERRTPLWQTWVVFGAIIALLALEWGLRRRWGLA